MNGSTNEFMRYDVMYYITPKHHMCNTYQHKKERLNLRFVFARLGFLIVKLILIVSCRYSFEKYVDSCCATSCKYRSVLIYCL